MESAGGPENDGAQQRPQGDGGGVESGGRRGHRRWAPRAAWAVLGLLCSAWAWAGTGWVADLAADLTAQWLAVAMVIGLASGARRRWRASAAAGLCAVVAAAGVLTPRRASTARDADPGLVVRVLVMNTAPFNDHTDDLLALIRRADPDVLVILETPENLLGFLRTGGSVREALPYGWVPDRAGRGFTVVLTRWPQRGGPAWEGGAWATPEQGLRVMRVDRPDGAFLLLVAHPSSPRRAGKWAEGNALVERAAGVVNDRLLPEALPVVAAGDFNSAPTAYRSRLLSRRTGLCRAKPWWLPAGTWPAWSVWPLRTAIDDVFVDEGTGVVSWRAVAAPGSDHSAALVELAIGPG